MKTRWSPDIFYKAFKYAAIAHNGQTVPGTDLPYITHITGVCAELMAVITESTTSIHPLNSGQKKRGVTT